MGRRGNLVVFESTNISETGEVTPTKIGVHICYINTYLHDFFEPILGNSIFWWPMGRRGNLAVFESTNISETEEVTPTKIGVHVCYINIYLHDFFEPILSN